ncbi:MAG: flagellar hook-basal body protein [Pseudomonadota bacterium]
MVDALHIAHSGLTAQQARLNAISNNLANLNTPAFKKSGVHFEALISQVSVNRNDATGDARGGSSSSSRNGVRVGADQIDMTQGALAPSENPADFALSGQGFLPVVDDRGSERLVRGGRLAIDDAGFLGIGNGWRLAAQINVPPGATNLAIRTDGVVTVVLDDGRLVELGRLDVKMTRDAAGMTLIGEGLYEARSGHEVLEGYAGEAGMAEIRQGFVEQSNVSLNEEMVELIVAQRGFQMNARVVQLSDQILETINNLRR